MVFSSPVFLFLFLPLVLLGAALVPVRLRNTFLLLASLVFYAWGETWYVLVMLASIALNYVMALLVERFRGRPAAPWLLGVCVALNLALLVGFKYLNFALDSLAPLLGWLGMAPPSLGPVHLPAGISFFTFQALSYVIDVHRRDGQVQRSPADLALYVAFFPQLIAGPIVRYADVDAQIRQRSITLERFAEGVRRFTVGLGKKLLLANTLAVPADRIFELPPEQLTAGLAWLGATCYALQIYFDFAGYSEMAIGLGKMFGFDFLENFNYPYVSRSITEFWRRWHISLSSWFRDYLYIPLGGNRHGRARTYLNLLIVFFLCGLWHGASWTFVVWGLFHGAFLVLERVGLQGLVARLPAPLQHAYTLVVVLVGWVFFRADTLPAAAHFVRAMAGLSSAAGAQWHAGLFLEPDVLVMLGVGAVGATPLAAAAWQWLKDRAGRPEASGLSRWATGALGSALLLGLLGLSVVQLSAGTYNPFIYFRF